MSKPKKSSPFVLPPHLNAEPHRLLMERLDKMTPEEQVQSLVNAGICDKDGHLLPPYNGEELKEESSTPKRHKRTLAAKTARR
jgi:hypothetical protein